MAWDDDIEGQTLQIAGSTHSPLRVVAGPGTGKTFALIRRVARLLEDGADPERILVVTFTRTAAQDFATALEELIVPGTDEIKKGTLHSFCFSMLQSAHVFDHTQRHPRPLLNYAERFLLEDLRENPEFGNYYARRDRLRAFAAAWAREQDQEPGWMVDPIDQQFQQHLYSWLRFHEAMLLSELVFETLRYLRNNPACPERQQYDHILVDEYQDLNRAEQRVIDFLSENGALTIIGDGDQSIYEFFRHAHPEGIHEFCETHEGTQDIPLEICRRCPPNIITMANALIRFNHNRELRQLASLPDRPDGEVHIVQWNNMEEEANGISEFIRSRIRNGNVDPGSILVLSPRRQFGYMIRDTLVNLNPPISAHSYFHEQILDGNPKLLENCRAQEAYTLLNLMVNPRDRVALRVWLGFGRSDLGTPAYRQLQAHCSESGQHPRDALDAVLAGELTINGINTILERYQLLVEQETELGELPGQDMFTEMFPSEVDWAEPFRTIATDFVETWVPENILDALRTNIIQPELPSDVDYVRVMSLHKSKGLSADTVIVTEFVEGLIPGQPDDNFTPVEKKRYAEEQRRLFYVAITRARQTLIISSVRSLPYDLACQMRAQIAWTNGIEVHTVTSTFFNELGPGTPMPISGANWEY